MILLLLLLSVKLWYAGFIDDVIVLSKGYDFGMNLLQVSQNILNEFIDTAEDWKNIELIRI